MLCKPGALEKVMAEHHVLVPTTVQCPGKKVDLWRAASVVSCIGIIHQGGRVCRKHSGKERGV